MGKTEAEQIGKKLSLVTKNTHKKETGIPRISSETLDSVNHLTDSSFIGWFIGTGWLAIL